MLHALFCRSSIASWEITWDYTGSLSREFTWEFTWGLTREFPSEITGENAERTNIAPNVERPNIALKGVNSEICSGKNACAGTGTG